MWTLLLSLIWHKQITRSHISKKQANLHNSRKLNLVRLHPVDTLFTNSPQTARLEVRKTLGVRRVICFAFSCRPLCCEAGRCDTSSRHQLIKRMQNK
ncbi:unnamed protein product [Allacma fusca]|uniref:Uncharacterized protein n=1 Tax=Allacma fusca TaxID=39272 RepID=A0A8J2PDV5_9HEXA|nr:unnamed protein product [Allacma fusca]